MVQVPPNGLVVYTGTILTDEGKEKKVNIDFEPFKPINTSLYLCDNKFHTEALNELLESDSTCAFSPLPRQGLGLRLPHQPVAMYAPPALSWGRHPRTCLPARMSASLPPCENAHLPASLRSHRRPLLPDPAPLSR